jgi:hypothetical protein
VVRGYFWPVPLTGSPGADRHDPGVIDAKARLRASGLSPEQIRMVQPLSATRVLSCTSQHIALTNGSSIFRDE